MTTETLKEKKMEACRGEGCTGWIWRGADSMHGLPIFFLKKYKSENDCHKTLKLLIWRIILFQQKPQGKTRLESSKLVSLNVGSL